MLYVVCLATYCFECLRCWLRFWLQADKADLKYMGLDLVKGEVVFAGSTTELLRQPELLERYLGV